MTGLTLPRDRTVQPGRHLDGRAINDRIARRLNPAGFLQWMVVVCVALALWPATLGGSFGMVIVAGNSMEPTYMLGDAVITWTRPVGVGDVILYRVPDGEPGEGNPVIHRVIGGDASGWITQGDNTDRPDDWVPSKDDVLGVAQFEVPLGGQVLAILRSWWLLALLGAVAVLLLLWPEPEDEGSADDNATDDDKATTGQPRRGTKHRQPRGRHLA